MINALTKLQLGRDPYTLTLISSPDSYMTPLTPGGPFLCCAISPGPNLTAGPIPSSLTAAVLFKQFLFSQRCFRRKTHQIQISTFLDQVIPTDLYTTMAPSNLLSPPNGSRPKIRRLSSMTATEKDIKEGGPVVITPERMMAERSQSQHGGFAASLESARHELSEIDLEEEAMIFSSSSSPETPGTPASPLTPADRPTADSFAFAFDIDGVLIRGGRPIPEAIEAMKVLNGENEYGMKV